MMRGRRDEASLEYPDIGAVLARELGRADSQVPDYVSFYFATEGRDFSPGSAGFLGSRYAPMELYNEHDAGEHPPPEDSQRGRPPRPRRSARSAEQAVRARPRVAEPWPATTKPTSACAA